MLATLPAPPSSSPAVPATAPRRPTTARTDSTHSSSPITQRQSANQALNRRRRRPSVPSLPTNQSQLSLTVPFPFPSPASCTDPSTGQTIQTQRQWQLSSYCSSSPGGAGLRWRDTGSAKPAQGNKDRGRSPSLWPAACGDGRPPRCACASDICQQHMYLPSRRVAAQWGTGERRQVGRNGMVVVVQDQANTLSHSSSPPPHPQTAPRWLKTTHIDSTQVVCPAA